MIRIVGIVVGLILAAPIDALDPAALRAPNWDATLAMQTAAVPETQASVQELFGLLRDGDLTALERRLDTLIAGGSLPQPARDSILFHFAVGLADFDAVEARLIERLRSVEPTVFVPHEERPGLGVPLFNIAGAAEGVYHLGLRREARAQAGQRIDASPQDWVKIYLLASPAQRLGFADALGTAPDEALAGILEVALQRLSESPELTPIAGTSALLRSDEAALEQVVLLGGGSDLSRILEAAGLTLPAADALALLRFAVNEAPATNAALAIAQLYPPLSARPEATELLFDTLSDDALGASAALALAGVNDPDVRNRLRQLAEEGDGPSAARAGTALAIELQRGGRRP